MALAVDRTFLTEHASFRRDSVEELLVHVSIGDDRLFGVLDAPSDPRDTGFVVCHSYGIEFLTLRRAERAVARSLATQGFPVLAVHRRGFGDSTGELSEQTFGAQLDDIRRARDWLVERTGITRVGLIGARFGGLVAGTLARDGDVSRMILINPSLRGADYFRQLFREARLTQVAIVAEEGEPTKADLTKELDTRGMADALGYPVYRILYDEAVAVDLVREPGRFAAEAIIFSVARRPSVPSDIANYARTVESHGGRSQIHTLEEPPRAPFGGPSFVSTDDPVVRIDAHAELVSEIVRTSKGWMRS